MKRLNRPAFMTIFLVKRGRKSTLNVIVFTRGIFG